MTWHPVRTLQRLNVVRATRIQVALDVQRIERADVDAQNSLLPLPTGKSTMPLKAM